ncbi:hypothetical protein KXR53_10615 [Inquilinus limosus]|uniref:hypothetical protein n=1 Tax=Inquilinus limosus TaxID=171674 RepID=UPI003F15D9F4
MKESIKRFDPEFISGVRSASSGDMLELIAVIRRPLPNDYKNFLEFMGLFDGGLFFKEGFSSAIGDVIAYCDECLAQIPEHNFDLCVPIAIGIDFEGLGMVSAPDTNQSRIVFLENGRAGEPAFDSLPAMCFSHAFMYEQCATGRWAIVHPAFDPPGTDVLSQLFSARGYFRQWFSMTNQLYFRRENKLITVVADPGQSPEIYVGGLEAAAIEAALSDIRDVVGKCRLEWREETTLPEARKYTLDALDEGDD